MTAARNSVLRFAAHPIVNRLAAFAFALAFILLQPNAPIGGGTGV